MTVKHLDHINLSIADFEQTVNWYVKDPTGYEIEVALWSNDEIMFRVKTSDNF